jgi:hypothetical protein
MQQLSKIMRRGSFVYATARPLGTHVLARTKPYVAISTSSHFDKALASLGLDTSSEEELGCGCAAPVRSTAPFNTGGVF